MNRKSTRYAVMILAILLAELLHAYTHSLLHDYLNATSPYKSVAISMLAVVLVFYPALRFIEKYFKPATEKYVTGAKKIAMNRSVGLIVGFVLALFLLFAAFSQIWYHRNPLVDFKTWLTGMF